MKPALPIMLTLLALSACTSGAMRRETTSLASRFAQSSESYIVAAIDNSRTVTASRAGSTPRGYDSAASYGPSLRARQVMRSIETDYGLHEVASWPIEPLHMHCAVLEVPADADRSSILDALARDQRVRIAQPLQTFTTRTEVYNDPYVGLQHGLEVMDIADAHPLSRGEGVKIALIDTGVDVKHPDLRGSIAVSENFVDSDDRQFNRDIHGTEVAGVIAAIANNHEGIVGISPGAQLMVFKACWQLDPEIATANCNSFTLAKALVAALDARAQIVNLSLAGPKDLLLHKLIEEGVHRGILFVGAAPSDAVAAGEGADGFLDQAGVIDVATAEEPHTHAAASIYAPGREILTLMPGGHYGFASGSSLATAHVTGTVALLLAKHPALTNASVHQLLSNSTTQIQSGTDVIRSVDACAAVVALMGRGACRSLASEQGAGSAISPLAQRADSKSK